MSAFLWKEYRALWRIALDDSDIGEMFLARVAILAVHALAATTIGLGFVLIAMVFE